MTTLMTAPMTAVFRNCRFSSILAESGTQKLFSTDDGDCCMDLFSKESRQSENQPLAYRMRPRTLDEYAGQDHIVGRGRLLRRAIQADQLSSIIFYGPPGTGKTTLARVIANTTKSHFSTLNAVLTGVKQLREEITAAKERLNYYQKRTILFVDEVHRWNKSQQDALLPWVENGTIILIGATTENPYFEVNSALVSRSRIFQLLPLGRNDLQKIAEMTLKDTERGYGNYRITFETGALEHLIDVANGDARSLLNALELAVETTPAVFPPPQGSDIYISMEAAEESIQQKVVLYDKEGDYHFDVISAFIKSVRGSDPDAVLYWLARMVRAGEDPRFIFRRMLISASEDIGLADPYALGVVESAAAAFDRVGMPEGRFHLTHAALYLACAPKSNSTLGFFDALSSIEHEQHQEVPVHLKDPSRDGEGFGHGEGYLYPHAYRDHWVPQQYLPPGLQGKLFYRPSVQGFEANIQEKVVRLREAQLEASHAESMPEALSFSPPDSASDMWLRRLSSERGPIYSEIRESIFRKLHLQRHFRVLDASAGMGLLLWESCRLVPEGGVYGLIPPEKNSSLIEHYSRQLETVSRPQIIRKTLADFAASKEADLQFEAVIGRDVLSRSPEKEKLLTHIRNMLTDEGELSLAETIPRAGTRLSQIVRRNMDTAAGTAGAAGTARTAETADMSAVEEKMRYFSSAEELAAFLETAEERIFSDDLNHLVNWDASALQKMADEAGFHQTEIEIKEFSEKRFISRQDISRWMQRSYLPSSRQMTGEHTAEKSAAADADSTDIVHDVSTLLGDTACMWNFHTAFLYGRKLQKT